jgi:hypothetical protein
MQKVVGSNKRERRVGVPPVVKADAGQLELRLAEQAKAATQESVE